MRGPWTRGVVLALVLVASHVADAKAAAHARAPKAYKAPAAKAPAKAKASKTIGGSGSVRSAVGTWSVNGVYHAPRSTGRIPHVVTHKKKV